jgi:hypothetical protein
MPRGRTIRTDRARERFIATLADSCNVSEACRAAGIGRTTAYEWKGEDASFAAAWEQAEQEAADKLEREAWRRAVEGTDKPVTFQGRVCDTYKEYSDRMLEILLKAHRPEKFIERQRLDHGVTPEAAQLIREGMSPKKAAEAFRDELG